MVRGFLLTKGTHNEFSFRLVAVLLLFLPLVLCHDFSKGRPILESKIRQQQTKGVNLRYVP